MITRPLADAASGHPIAWLHQNLTALRAERATRRHLRALLKLPGILHGDLGLTRGEIETAINLPLSRDAAAELHRLSLQRSRARG